MASRGQALSRLHAQDWLSTLWTKRTNIDGLVQDCGKFHELAMDLLQAYANSSKNSQRYNCWLMAWHRSRFCGIRTDWATLKNANEEIRLVSTMHVLQDSGFVELNDFSWAQKHLQLVNCFFGFQIRANFD